VIRNQSLGAMLLALPALWVFLHVDQEVCVPRVACVYVAGGLVTPAVLLATGAVVLYLAALLEALSRCIRMKTWRWLFAIVPFGPPGLFLYGRYGPEDAVPELHDWFDPMMRKKRGRV
jgi:hypothetical protein